MEKDILFLKELQQELLTQEHDSQASPRFWTIGDYKMISCSERFQDCCYMCLPKSDYYGDINELLKDIKEEITEPNGYSDTAKEEFQEIGCEVSALNWVKNYCQLPNA